MRRVLRSQDHVEGAQQDRAHNLNQQSARLKLREDNHTLGTRRRLAAAALAHAAH